MVEAVKLPIAEEDLKFTGEEKNFNFSVEELKFFTLEIRDMLIEGKEIDFGKAARNAKYLARIERGIKNLNEGKGVTFTFEELERLINNAQSRI
ncbi:MAG: hypothetical protein IJQ16_04680 [Selenomonadaceae bacterium]|nr:hypothetical protein [Selenomonadaceae bacterium]